MYLPTPHTDFIFPIVCEELGLLGALAMLALFAVLLVRGIRIARSAPNLFGTLLAAGITFTICLQAFFNVGMSLGQLPTKGIPLPFISFGGSSLLATLIGVGVLLNISRQSSREAH
jgi:cell division protein FtsW